MNWDVMAPRCGVVKDENGVVMGVCQLKMKGDVCVSRSTSSAAVPRHSLQHCTHPSPRCSIREFNPGYYCALMGPAIFCGAALGALTNHTSVPARAHQ